MAQASVTRTMGSGSLSPEAARRRDPCPGETGRRRHFFALRPAMAGAELWRNFGDGVNQAADFFSAATSIPSRNVTPLTTFGN